MVVTVLGYGSNWWARYGSDPNDPHRFTRRAAYYNSTGIQCGRKVRRHWVIPGLIRHNGAGDFNPHLPERSVGHPFICSELMFVLGGNRLLFERRAPKAFLPEYFLLTLSSDRFGTVNFRDPRARSTSCVVICASSLRERQEAMLLMKPGDWIRTSTGRWELRFSAKRGTRPALEFVVEGA